MKEVTVQMEVQQAWLNNNTLYFPKNCADLFPPDCFGARGKDDLAFLPAKGIPVRLVYQGSSVETDIAKEIKSGRIRPRERGSIGRFYKTTGANVGDFVIVTKVGDREFRINLVKSSGTTV